MHNEISQVIENGIKKTLLPGNITEYVVYDPVDSEPIARWDIVINGHVVTICQNSIDLGRFGLEQRPRDIAQWRQWAVAVLLTMRSEIT